MKIWKTIIYFWHFYTTFDGNKSVNLQKKMKTSSAFIVIAKKNSQFRCSFLSVVSELVWAGPSASFLFTGQSNQSISLSRTLIGTDIFQVSTGNISSQKLKKIVKSLRSKKSSNRRCQAIINHKKRLICTKMTEIQQIDYQFQNKCDNLLKLLPNIQCHNCKAVPGPRAADRNRYVCRNSHHLCEECKYEKCPCGSSTVLNSSSRQNFH